MNIIVKYLETLSGLFEEQFMNGYKHYKTLIHLIYFLYFFKNIVYFLVYLIRTGLIS